MYQRILVPLDGSALSEEVLPYAAGIARATGARLALLRVAGDEPEQAEARAYLEAVAERFSPAATTTSVVDDVAGGILRQAGGDRPTLVAMTSHGRGRIPGVLLGSVANEVLRRAGRPVLLYHPGTAPAASSEPREISTVVLALDGSEFSERMEPVAVEFAAWLRAQLLIVQAIAEAAVPAGAPAGDVLESSYVHLRAERIAEEHGLSPEWEVLHGAAADAICHFVEGRQDAVLAMTSHGRSGLGRAIFGSVAAECMRRSGVPVLVQALSE